MKKVIAGAVAAAFIAPAAFAVVSSDNVTLYGSIRVFGTYVDGDKAGSAFKLLDGSSRIGFKGADKINNDLAVIWQIETGTNVANSSGNTWASRNSFVGLDTTWGTFRAGTYDSAYKLMDTTGPQSALFDAYGDAVDPKQSFGFYGRANARLKNSISYETPNSLKGDWGAFTGRLTYGVDNSAQNNGNGWIGAASATYSYGGFNLGVGYQYADKQLAMTKSTSGVVSAVSGNIERNALPGGSKNNGAQTQAVKVAANYKFDMGLNIGAAWEYLEDKWDSKTFSTPGSYVAGGKSKQNSYWLAANYPIGNWLLEGGYGYMDKLKGDLVKNQDDTKAQMALLGGQYNLSKRSRLYGYVFWVDNDKNASFSLGSQDTMGFSGNNTRKVNGSTVTAGTDQSGYGVTFGLRTDF